MVDKNAILLDLYQDAKNPNSYGSIQGLLQSTQNILPSIKREYIVNLLKTQKAYIYMELQIKTSKAYRL